MALSTKCLHPVWGQFQNLKRLLVKRKAVRSITGPILPWLSPHYGQKAYQSLGAGKLKQSEELVQDWLLLQKGFTNEQCLVQLFYSYKTLRSTLLKFFFFTNCLKIYFHILLFFLKSEITSNQIILNMAFRFGNKEGMESL